MRQRFVLGWIGSLILSAWMITGLFTVATCVNLGPGATVVAAADEEAPENEAGNASKSAPPPKESLLRWFGRTLGVTYSIAFLTLSFCLVALIVMNVLGARRDSIVPPALVEAFETHLNEKRYQEAYDLAKADNSMLGHILSAGMAKLSSGYDETVAAMEEVGQEENEMIEQRLNYVALIAQLGPMFGLLGTVDGMVQAFQVIASSDVTPKPSQLAQGIGTALVTTLVGLWIAIPAITFHHVMKNRFAKLTMDAAVISHTLMKRFSGTQPTKKA